MQDSGEVAPAGIGLNRTVRWRRYFPFHLYVGIVNILQETCGDPTMNSAPSPSLRPCCNLRRELASEFATSARLFAEAVVALTGNSPKRLHPTSVPPVLSSSFERGQIYSEKRAARAVPADCDRKNGLTGEVDSCQTGRSHLSAKPHIVLYPTSSSVPSRWIPVSV